MPISSPPIGLLPLSIVITRRTSTWSYYTLNPSIVYWILNYTLTCAEVFESLVSRTPSTSVLFRSKISSALELSGIRIIDFGANRRDLGADIEFPAYDELNSYALRPVPVPPRTDPIRDLMQGIEAVMMTT
jgi:hypothetical protein